jgi:hypothetical protein
MTKDELLADFLSRYEVPGIRRVQPYGPYRFLSVPQPYYLQPETSSEAVAENLLAIAEFRALQLGTWLGTTDGQRIAQAVEMVTPPIYRPDVVLLVDGLKLAAEIQQREGQKIAGALALGVVLVAGLLAFGSSPAAS